MLFLRWHSSTIVFQITLIRINIIIWTINHHLSSFVIVSLEWHLASEMIYLAYPGSHLFIGWIWVIKPINAVSQFDFQVIWSWLLLWLSILLKKIEGWEFLTKSSKWLLSIHALWCWVLLLLSLISTFF